MKNVTLVVDLQFGSTGKGLIAGYLAERDQPDVVINANMPNAGHTYINDEGRVWMHKVLPNGIVSPKLRHAMIGPQSVFDVSVLRKEVMESRDILEGKSIFIHESAVVLSEVHRLAEQESLSHISSTMQGSAAASISKMVRNPSHDHRAKSSDALGDLITDAEAYGINVEVISQAAWLLTLSLAEKVLAEGAQGYSLGLNAGFWPYCTSRDCTPARFLADIGIPVKMLDKVVGTARVHPIRVGNTADGYSGDVYHDQRELSWEELGQIPELTTVTKRVRRVFTFSTEQMYEAIAACEPDEIFLNFANYDEKTAAHICDMFNITYLGFGPKRCDIKDLRHEQVR